MIGKEYTMEAEVAMDKVNTVIAKAADETKPKYDSIFYTKVQFVVNGRWHEIETTPKEFCQIMQSGEVDGRQLIAAELFKVSTDVEDAGFEDKVRVVYNFLKKHTNENPWTMI